MNIRTTQVPGEPAQYNGWTGPELLALVGRLETENKRLERKVSDLTRDCVYGHNVEIERLKALVARAAEALAGCTWQERDALIGQLRRAGE